MRHAFTLALLVLACTTSFASHQRWDHINCGTCVQTLVDDVNDCSDLRVVFNDREAVRAEEMVTVGEARSLTIRAPQSGGIYVRGTESSRFSVKACKAVEFGELLANVHVNVNGDNMTATGPNASGWIVYFLVDMPRAARGDFATSNGPVQIRDVDGSIVARAQNGPVSAKNTRGSIDLRGQNGPVAFSGSSATNIANITAALNALPNVLAIGASFTGNVSFVAGTPRDLQAEIALPTSCQQ